MLDIGWTELLLIGVVALIVVGPKDLPGMFRTLGKATARMRSMAREFQRAIESAADETGVRDVASDLRDMTSAKRLGLDSVQDATKKFKGGWKSGLDALVGDDEEKGGSTAAASGGGNAGADSGDGGAEGEAAAASPQPEPADEPKPEKGSGSTVAAGAE